MAKRIRKRRKRKHDGPESPIERILLRALQDYGLIPTCQYVIGEYRVDFAFLEDKLVVEADGAAWHSKPAQKLRDAKREKFIRERGWRVLRFTGAQIFQDAYYCARQVRLFLKKGA